MSNAELIAELQKLPPNQRVLAATRGRGTRFDIRRVVTDIASVGSERKTKQVNRREPVIVMVLMNPDEYIMSYRPGRAAKGRKSFNTSEQCQPSTTS